MLGFEKSFKEQQFVNLKLEIDINFSRCWKSTNFLENLQNIALWLFN